MHRSTLRRTLVAALAASAMVASTAAASPQDLRGEYAQDAARIAAQHQDLRGEHARDAARGINTGTVVAKPPVYWSYDYEAGKPSPRPASAPAPKPADGGSDVWLILGIALGASGIVAGSAVAVGRRARVRAAA